MKSPYDSHPIMSALSNHPLVDECGHSGGTMVWTCGHLRRMHTVGWESFVMTHLRNEEMFE